MKILSSSIKKSQGYPFLILKTDQGEVQIILEQKFWERGFIFLGSEWEDKMPVLTIPPNPDDHADEIELYGFTDDPEIVKAYKQFREQHK